MARPKSSVAKSSTAPEKPPAKRGRKPKKTEESESDEPEPPTAKKTKLDNKSSTSKGSKKNVKAVAKDISPTDSEAIEEETKETKPDNKKKPAKPLMNKSSTSYGDIDFQCKKKTASGDSWNFKISSWNVDGIRAWLNKGGLEYINYEKPDIFCLQETKCSQSKLPSEVVNVPDYLQYWVSSDKEGYAGVGLYTKKEPISVSYGIGEDFDTEGRIITAEFEKFFLITTYVPNSGRGLVTLPKRLEWNKVFRTHVKKLDEKKPVIVCGDMNVSHLEIDLTNPKTNKKNAGFTQEERDGMSEFLGDGFVDTYRKLYPEETGQYTFWTYMSNCRAKNIGWRLDYAIVSERLMPSVCDNVIRSEVYGSDHCPLTLFLHLKD